MENKKRTPRKVNTTPELDNKVIDIKRVTKVTKGGRTFSFAACVAVGNKKGSVGMGTGKAKEVPDAIKKAIQAASKSMINVSIVDNHTISHDIIGKSGAARVLLKPATKGCGVIAGGPVRTIIELAGINDVLSKSLGSNTKINVARATIDALKQQRTKEHIAQLRGKKVEEIL